MSERLLKIDELAKVVGKRQSTLKYYTDIGILPYWQKESRLARYYDKDEVVKRLKEIEELKQKGMNIKQITERFKAPPKQLIFWDR